MSQKFDRVFINTMDRCVWFILLAVMSHLVTEFAGVNAYARGYRDNNLVQVNDTTTFEPVHDKISFSNGFQLEMLNEPEEGAPIEKNSGTEGVQKTFGISPLLDSIFEIPISTLNAVNNFVQRLAGNIKATTRSFAAALPMKTVTKTTESQSNS